MAELTVDYYTILDSYTGVPKPTLQKHQTQNALLGKFTLTPRSQGFEWKTTDVKSQREGLYLGFKMVEFTPKIDFSPIKVILNGNMSYISGKFLNPENHQLFFNETDVMKIYNFLCEKMEWSPEAIGEGTAHPNLMAASDRFSTGKRRTRKARK